MATFVKFDEERFLNMDLVTQVSWDRIERHFLVWVVGRLEPFILNNDERIVMNLYLEAYARDNSFYWPVPDKQSDDDHAEHDSCRRASNSSDTECPYCRGVAWKANHNTNPALTE